MNRESREIVWLDEDDAGCQECGKVYVRRDGRVYIYTYPEGRLCGTCLAKIRRQKKKMEA